KEYGDAAIVDIVAEALPKIVAEAARPMSQIDTMTVISTDGASQTARSVASTVAQGQGIAKSLFGIDLGELVQGFVEAKLTPDESAGEASPAAVETTDADEPDPV
ncbi:MAG: flotillin domain-containing protein, partial [Brevundimonas sp.]|nr:flotillin domain-containing protein [Brevundimonas sp.]